MYYLIVEYILQVKYISLLRKVCYYKFFIRRQISYAGMKD